MPTARPGWARGGGRADGQPRGPSARLAVILLTATIASGCDGDGDADDGRAWRFTILSSDGEILAETSPRRVPAETWGRTV